MMYLYFFFLFELQSSLVFEKIAQTSFSLNKLHNNNWNQDITKMNFKFFLNCSSSNHISRLKRPLEIFQFIMHNEAPAALIEFWPWVVFQASPFDAYLNLEYP